jgi:hypothetical protein
MSMMPRPNRIATELPGLRFPSDEFRTKLFELNEGDVTVAPNQPQDLYYVVAVSKRQVASREDFVRSKQMIEMQVESEQATKMVTDWLVNLRRESAGAVSGSRLLATEFVARRHATYNRVVGNQRTIEEDSRCPCAIC